MTIVIYVSIRIAIPVNFLHLTSRSPSTMPQATRHGPLQFWPGLAALASKPQFWPSFWGAVLTGSRKALAGPGFMHLCPFLYNHRCPAMSSPDRASITILSCGHIVNVLLITGVFDGSILQHWPEGSDPMAPMGPEETQGSHLPK